MAYTINLTDGSVFATIADGTINTSSSMTLVGKNYAGYGEFLDENFVHLLESGSNTVPPGAPLTGQLWWDKTNSLLKVYNGSTFKTLSLSTASASAPSSNVIGDLWYDTTNQQLKVWSGSTWILIGPAFTAGTGTTGAIVDTIVDNTLVSHVVIKLYVSDSVVGIVSKDAAFTPQSSIPGFTQVKPGITLATLVGTQVPLFQGTATDSQTLDGLDSTSFMRTDASTSTTGTLSVLNDTGLTVGADSDFRVSVSGVNVTVQNQSQDGNIAFRVNDGGVATTVMTLDGANGVATMPSVRLTGSSSGYVGLAPAAAAGSTTYTLPSADGTSGQSLVTNGSGTLSWGSSLPAGTLIDFAGTSAPTGFLVCDGSTVSRTTYATLFAAIGTTWNTGGEAGTVFRLPNLSRRTTVGSGGAGTGTLGATVGSVGGAETVTLSTSEIPAHNHPINISDPTHAHGVTDPTHAHGGIATNRYDFDAPTGDSNIGYWTEGSTDAAATGISIDAAATGITATSSNTGGGSAHNNMQPSAVVLKIIKF